MNFKHAHLMYIDTESFYSEIDERIVSALKDDHGISDEVLSEIEDDHGPFESFHPDESYTYALTQAIKNCKFLGPFHDSNHQIDIAQRIYNNNCIICFFTEFKPDQADIDSVISTIVADTVRNVIDLFSVKLKRDQLKRSARAKLTDEEFRAITSGD